MQPIFHLTTADCWAEAVASGEYRWSTRGKTLDDVGFIHSSFLEQVERVADFVYAGAAAPNPAQSQRLLSASVEGAD